MNSLEGVVVVSVVVAVGGAISTVEPRINAVALHRMVQRRYGIPM